jgi:hypothetical protein
MSEGGMRCCFNKVATTDSLYSVKVLQVALGRRTTKSEQTAGWKTECPSRTNRDQGTVFRLWTD